VKQKAISRLVAAIIAASLVIDVTIIVVPPAAWSEQCIALPDVSAADRGECVPKPAAASRTRGRVPQRHSEVRRKP